MKCKDVNCEAAAHVSTIEMVWWKYFLEHTPDGYEIVESIDRILNGKRKAKRGNSNKNRRL